jgi:hypothetical protein
MVVAAETVRQARKALAEAGDVDSSHLAELRSHSEIIGYMIAASRAEGRGDDLYGVELYVRALALDKQTISEVEGLLRRLGYADVSKLLRRLAGRAKRRSTWLERIAARRARRGY